MTMNGPTSALVQLSNANCQAFIERAIGTLREDDRFVAVPVAGSAIAAEMDEFSDLDLILVCRAEAREAVMNERRSIAASLGPLLAAFTGEHVGEPALLICLYDDPLLHVDLKFVVASQLSSRVETPLVGWSRDDEIEKHLLAGRAQWPNKSPEWFEERFWIWLHYAAQKLGRGELFEAIDMLAFIRQQVLGPMNARNAGRDQRGVRRVERFAPEFARTLRRTLCMHDKNDVRRALHAAVSIYQDLRAAAPPSATDESRSRIVVRYLEQV